MEYKSAIVDELGYVVAFCENLAKQQIEEYLFNHPEHSVRLVDVESE